MYLDAKQVQWNKDKGDEVEKEYQKINDCSSTNNVITNAIVEKDLSVDEATKLFNLTIQKENTESPFEIYKGNRVMEVTVKLHEKEKSSTALALKSGPTNPVPGDGSDDSEEDFQDNEADNRSGDGGGGGGDDGGGGGGGSRRGVDRCNGNKARRNGDVLLKFFNLFTVLILNAVIWILLLIGSSTNAGYHIRLNPLYCNRTGTMWNIGGHLMIFPELFDQHTSTSAAIGIRQVEAYVEHTDLCETQTLFNKTDLATLDDMVIINTHTLQECVSIQLSITELENNITSNWPTQENDNDTLHNIVLTLAICQATEYESSPFFSDRLLMGESHGNTTFVYSRGSTLEVYASNATGEPPYQNHTISCEYATTTNTTTWRSSQISHTIHGITKVPIYALVLRRRSINSTTESICQLIVVFANNWYAYRLRCIFLIKPLELSTTDHELPNLKGCSQTFKIGYEQPLHQKILSTVLLYKKLDTCLCEIINTYSNASLANSTTTNNIHQDLRLQGNDGRMSQRSTNQHDCEIAKSNKTEEYAIKDLNLHHPSDYDDMVELRDQTQCEGPSYYQEFCALHYIMPLAPIECSVNLRMQSFKITVKTSVKLKWSSTSINTYRQDNYSHCMQQYIDTTMPATEWNIAIYIVLRSISSRQICEQGTFEVFSVKVIANTRLIITCLQPKVPPERGIIHHNYNNGIVHSYQLCVSLLAIAANNAEDQHFYNCKEMDLTGDVISNNTERLDPICSQYRKVALKIDTKVCTYEKLHKKTPWRFYLDNYYPVVVDSIEHISVDRICRGVLICCCYVFCKDSIPHSESSECRALILESYLSDTNTADIHNSMPYCFNDVAITASFVELCCNVTSNSIAALQTDNHVIYARPSEKLSKVRTYHRPDGSSVMATTSQLQSFPLFCCHCKVLVTNSLRHCSFRNVLQTFRCIDVPLGYKLQFKFWHNTHLIHSDERYTIAHDRTLFEFMSSSVVRCVLQSQYIQSLIGQSLLVSDMYYYILSPEVSNSFMPPENKSRSLQNLTYEEVKAVKRLNKLDQRHLLLPFNSFRMIEMHSDDTVVVIGSLVLQQINIITSHDLLPSDSTSVINHSPGTMLFSSGKCDANSKVLMCTCNSLTCSIAVTGAVETNCFIDNKKQGSLLTHNSSCILTTVRNCSYQHFMMISSQHYKMHINAQNITTASTLKTRKNSVDCQQHSLTGKHIHLIIDDTISLWIRVIGVNMQYHTISGDYESQEQDILLHILDPSYISLIFSETWSGNRNSESSGSNFVDHQLESRLTRKTEKSNIRTYKDINIHCLLGCACEASRHVVQTTSSIAPGRILCSLIINNTLRLLWNYTPNCQTYAEIKRSMYNWNNDDYNLELLSTTPNSLPYKFCFINGIRKKFEELVITNEDQTWMPSKKLVDDQPVLYNISTNCLLNSTTTTSTKMLQVLDWFGPFFLFLLLTITVSYEIYLLSTKGMIILKYMMLFTIVRNM